MNESQVIAKWLKVHFVALLISISFSAVMFQLDATHDTLKQLLTPLAVLPAIYLGLAGTPFWVGRMLSLSDWALRPVIASIYILWSGLLALTICDFSIERLTKTVFKLPLYIDSHGNITLSVLLFSIVIYLVARKTTLRESDIFSLLPSACFVSSMFLASNIGYDHTGWGLPPVFLLVLVAATASAFVGNALRIAQKVRD